VEHVLDHEKDARVDHGKALLVRIVSMLCRLVDRFSPTTKVHEEGCEYLVGGSEEM